MVDLDFFVTDSGGVRGMGKTAFAALKVATIQLATTTTSPLPTLRFIDKIVRIGSPYIALKLGTFV